MGGVGIEEALFCGGQTSSHGHNVGCDIDQAATLWLGSSRRDIGPKKSNEQEEIALKRTREMRGRASFKTFAAHFRSAGCIDRAVFAYVGRHVLAGEPGVHLVGGPVVGSHAPEGAGEEVHGEEHDGEQPRDLSCSDEAGGYASLPKGKIFSNGILC